MPCGARQNAVDDGEGDLDLVQPHHRPASLSGRSPSSTKGGARQITMPPSATSALIPPIPTPHCVRTATLVAPRVIPPASLNRTTMRLLAGSKGTKPEPLGKQRERRRRAAGDGRRHAGGGRGHAGARRRGLAHGYVEGEDGRSRIRHHGDGRAGPDLRHRARARLPEISLVRPGVTVAASAMTSGTGPEDAETSSVLTVIGGSWQTWVDVVLP